MYIDLTHPKWFKAIKNEEQKRRDYNGKANPHVRTIPNPEHDVEIKDKSEGSETAKKPA